MGKIDDAKVILKALGLPKPQQNDNAAYTLLAFSGVGPDDPWSSATATRSNPHGVIGFAAKSYDKVYAENTRETIRRRAIHQFVQGGVLVRNADDPDLATNSPLTHYALSDEALEVIHEFGQDDFEGLAEVFRGAHAHLAAMYKRARSRKKIPVTLPDGRKIVLSPGKHNLLHKAIVEDFLPRFAGRAEVLYIGDTDQKSLVVVEDALAELGVPVTKHDKLPDVVAFLRDRNWLFLIEAVTSHGPVGPKRHLELEEALSDCTAGRV